jgi:hypothetical protein
MEKASAVGPHATDLTIETDEPNAMMTNSDTFAKFRSSTAAYTAITGSDGRSLNLRAIDIAAFNPVANEVLTLANKNGWRIRSIQRLRPDGNILQIEIAPATPA